MYDGTCASIGRRHGCLRHCLTACPALVAVAVALAEPDRLVCPGASWRCRPLAATCGRWRHRHELSTLSTAAPRPRAAGHRWRSSRRRPPFHPAQPSRQRTSHPARGGATQSAECRGEYGSTAEAQLLPSPWTSHSSAESQLLHDDPPLMRSSARSVPRPRSVGLAALVTSPRTTGSCRPLTAALLPASGTHRCPWLPILATDAEGYIVFLCNETVTATTTWDPRMGLCHERHVSSVDVGCTGDLWRPRHPAVMCGRWRRCPSALRAAERIDDAARPPLSMRRRGPCRAQRARQPATSPASTGH